MLTVLFTAGKVEEKTPRQNIILIWEIALASASKGMYIIRGIDQN